MAQGLRHHGKDVRASGGLIIALGFSRLDMQYIFLPQSTVRSYLLGNNNLVKHPALSTNEEKLISASYPNSFLPAVQPAITVMKQFYILKVNKTLSSGFFLGGERSTQI